MEFEEFFTPPRYPTDDCPGGKPEERCLRLAFVMLRTCPLVLRDRKAQ